MEEEDKKLLECYVLHGGKWGAIGLALRRSGLGCRNRSETNIYTLTSMTTITRWRLLERKKNSASRQSEVPSQQDPSPVPSSFWTSFGENHSAISNWSSALGNWNLSVDTTFNSGDSPVLVDDSHAEDFGTNRFSSSSLVNPSSPNQRAAASFNFASSSLSSALTEPVLTFQGNAESTSTSSNAAIEEQEHDDAGSENWDFGMNMDNDDPVDMFSESANAIEPDVAPVVDQPSTHPEEPVHQVFDAGKEFDTEEIENRPSTEVHENAAANPATTVESSSMAVMSVTTHYPDRPRQRLPKRQRTNAQYVVLVDGTTGRETQQVPKLSSTLPIASE